METVAEQIVGASRKWIVVLVAIVGAHAGEMSTYAAGQAQARVSLRSVRFEPGDPPGPMSVVIEATGPLPEPASGSALNPPRIYLDFTDVWPIRLTEAVASPVISRIRAAENSATPLITRVVIDLTAVTSYRIDSSARAQGRVVVILGGGSSQISQKPVTPRPAGRVMRPREPRTMPTPTPDIPIPTPDIPIPPPTAPAAQPSPAPITPVPPIAPSARAPKPSTAPTTSAAPATTPTAPATAPPAPATTPAAPATTSPGRASTPSAAAATKMASDTQSAAALPRLTPAEAQYGLRVAPVLVRLHTLRPILVAIDRRTLPTPGGDMEATAVEFEGLAQLLNSLKPPSSRASAHALLLRACTLGARAARLRETPAANAEAAVVWDAASAAAGALMMIDTANRDLGPK